MYTVDRIEEETIILENRITKEIKEINKQEIKENVKDGENIVKFLKDLKIKDIDVLVGTHPHEDHIGGLDDIINNFVIGTI